MRLSDWFEQPFYFSVMENLDNIRKQIQAVDKEMAALFERRMQLAKGVMEFKQASGLPIYDEEQEKKILAHSAEYVQDPSLKEYHRIFVKNLMDVSKAYQERVMDKMKVAYCGIPGAYAHIAARKLYPTAQLISYPDFASAYMACEAGEVDVTLLPMENSHAGDVGDVMDLAFYGSLFVNVVVEMSIVQNLNGVKGAKISDIKKVVSHPQALAQCTEYIHKHGFEEEAFGNTAVASKYVAERGDVTLAAISSEDTAELYGLEILERKINTSNTNSTRFAVFSRTMNSTASKEHLGEHFILVFTVKNACGALAQALNLIGSHGFNMSSLHSRPLKGKMWGHYFFAELEGSVNSQDGQDLLIQLNTICSKMKHLGSYKQLTIDS